LWDISDRARDDYTDQGRVHVLSRGTTSFTFNYFAKSDNNGELTGLLKNVTFANSKGTVRKVAYEYYSQSDGKVDTAQPSPPFQGNQADLKLVTVTGAGQTVSTEYYRYQKKTGGIGGQGSGDPNQFSSLKLAMTNRATALAASAGVPLSSSTDSVLLPRADASFTFGAGFAAETLQGAGPSAEQPAANGTFTYSITRNSNSGPYPPVGHTTCANFREARNLQKLLLTDLFAQAPHIL
jgi:hypothetical protein